MEIIIIGVAIPLKQGLIFNSGVCFSSLFSVGYRGRFQLLQR